MYAIIVNWQVAEEDAEGFAELLEVQAKASVQDEPGCQTFDVCQDPEKPGNFVLYELYDDKAAFAAHLETPHFKRFDQRAGPITLDKTIQIMTRIIA